MGKSWDGIKTKGSMLDWVGKKRPRDRQEWLHCGEISMPLGVNLGECGRQGQLYVQPGSYWPSVATGHLKCR